MNELRLGAKVAELLPLRRTPAGVPVAACVLMHESTQTEAGVDRNVTVELQAVAIGELASVLAVVVPGTHVMVTGFLAAKSQRSRTPVMHLNKIEFVEGN